MQDARQLDPACAAGKRGSRRSVKLREGVTESRNVTEPTERNMHAKGEEEKQLLKQLCKQQERQHDLLQKLFELKKRRAQMGGRQWHDVSSQKHRREGETLEEGERQQERWLTANIQHEFSEKKTQRSPEQYGYYPQEAELEGHCMQQRHHEQSMNDVNRGKSPSATAGTYVSSLTPQRMPAGPNSHPQIGETRPNMIQRPQDWLQNLKTNYREQVRTRKIHDQQKITTPASRFSRNHGKLAEMQDHKHSPDVQTKSTTLQLEQQQQLQLQRQFEGHCRAGRPRQSPCRKKKKRAVSGDKRQREFSPAQKEIEVILRQTLSRKHHHSVGNTLLGPVRRDGSPQPRGSVSDFLLIKSRCEGDSLLRCNELGEIFQQTDLQNQRYDRTNLQESEEARCSPGFSTGYLRPRRSNSQPTISQRSGTAQDLIGSTFPPPDSLCVDTETTERNEHSRAMPVGSLSSPPPQAKPKAFSHSPARGRRGEKTTPVARRCLVTRTTSPCYLPSRIVTETTECDHTSTPVQQIPKSESFKTVPLRIKTSSVNSQPAISSGGKRDLAIDGSVERQVSDVNNLPPGAKLWVQTRKLKSCPKYGCPKRPRSVGGTGVTKSPQLRCATLQDRPRRVLKAGAPSNKRSLSREGRGKDKFLPPHPSTRQRLCHPGKCQALKKLKINRLTGQRSLSAGTVDICAKMTPVHCTSLARGRGVNSKVNQKSRSKPVTPNNKTKVGPEKQPQESGQTEAGRPPGFIDELTGWRMGQHPQAMSRDSASLLGPTDAAHRTAHFCRIGFEYLWELNTPDQLSARQDFLQRSGFFNPFQGNPRVDKSRDALLRFYHLPHSLKPLRRGGIGAFESMSLPMVCIDREALLSGFGPEMDSFRCTPELPTFPSKLRDCETEENKPSEANRLSTSPSYRGLLGSQSLSVNPEDAHCLPSLGLRDGMWVAPSLAKQEQSTSSGPSLVSDPNERTCPEAAGYDSKQETSQEDSGCPTSEALTFPLQRIRVQRVCQRGQTASSESWIKRREASPLKLSTSLNVVMGSAARPNASLARVALVETGDAERVAGVVVDGEADDSSSGPMSERPRLSRLSSIVLSLMPAEQGRRDEGEDELIMTSATAHEPRSGEQEDRTITSGTSSSHSSRQRYRRRVSPRRRRHSRRADSTLAADGSVQRLAEYCACIRIKPVMVVVLVVGLLVAFVYILFLYHRSEVTWWEEITRVLTLAMNPS